MLWLLPLHQYQVPRPPLVVVLAVMLLEMTLLLRTGALRWPTRAICPTSRSVRTRLVLRI